MNEYDIKFLHLWIQNVFEKKYHMYFEKDTNGKRNNFKVLAHARTAVLFFVATVHDPYTSL